MGEILSLEVVKKDAKRVFDCVSNAGIAIGRDVVAKEQLDTARQR